MTDSAMTGRAANGKGGASADDGAAPGGPSSSYDGSSSTNNTLWIETRLFLELAATTTLLNLGFFMTPLLSASYVGRLFGPIYLSGFTLANLTGNLCSFSLLAGLYSASDTLSPQAFGAGAYGEVGYIAMRGTVAALVVLVPINVLLVFFLEPCLLLLGQDSEAARLATSWYRVFVLSLPFSVVYYSTSKFLSSQHVMTPLIVVSVVCTGVVLPLGLEVCTQVMGFLGSALCFVLFQASQAILLLCYVWWKQPHDARTWPGGFYHCWRRAIRWDPMMEYLHLGAGGILAQSEWVFWEALGLVVGMVGVLELSAYTVPNQTIMALIQVPFSFGTAVAIRMGVSLPTSIRRTQHIALATTATSIFAFGFISIGAYLSSDWIISIFTTDDAVKELVQSIWFNVCLFNFVVAIFDVLWGIATGLGKQWSLGIINFVSLWIFGLPVIYYFAVIRGGGLQAVWAWINVPYMGMNICLILLFVFVDWYKVQEMIVKDNDDSDNNTIIMVGDHRSATELEKVVVTVDETTWLLL